MNDHEQRCRFLQVWLTPDRKGHRPQYGSTSYDKADRHNQLLHVLSGVGPSPAWQKVNSRDCIQLHADANVFVSENDGGVSYDLQLAPGRQAYLVCAEGKQLLMPVLTVSDGSCLQPQDQYQACLAHLLAHVRFLTTQPSTAFCGTPGSHSMRACCTWTILVHVVNSAAAAAAAALAGCAVQVLCK